MPYRALFVLLCRISLSCKLENYMESKNAKSVEKCVIALFGWFYGVKNTIWDIRKSQEELLFAHSTVFVFVCASVLLTLAWASFISQASAVFFSIYSLLALVRRVWSNILMTYYPSLNFITFGTAVAWFLDSAITTSVNNQPFCVKYRAIEISNVSCLYFFHVTVAQHTLLLCSVWSSS